MQCELVCITNYSSDEEPWLFKLFPISIAAYGGLYGGSKLTTRLPATQGQFKDSFAVQIFEPCMGCYRIVTAGRLYVIIYHWTGHRVIEHRKLSVNLIWSKISRSSLQCNWSKKRDGLLSGHYDERETFKIEKYSVALVLGLIRYTNQPTKIENQRTQMWFPMTWILTENYQKLYPRSTIHDPCPHK